jgi:hypothetical protein
MKAAIKTIDGILVRRRRRSSSRLYKICVLTKDMTPKRLNMKLSKEDTYHIFDTGRRRRDATGNN